eukprot:14046628-Ditylum_brightwellii.AAC.1
MHIQHEKNKSNNIISYKLNFTKNNPASDFAPELVQNPLYLHCFYFITKSNILKKNDFLAEEVVSKEGSDPSTYHICSNAQICFILPVSDVCLGITHTFQDSTTTFMCSSAVLRCPTGQTVKAYGMSETIDIICWIFNNSPTSTKAVSIPKSKRWHDSSPPHKFVGYICRSSVEGYTIIG